MEFDLDNVERVVEEDRLSSLPDELIHKILSSFDTNFVVQTCLLLSSRWKLLWTSVPILNFSSDHFRDLHKFDEFVRNVVYHRNHQVELSCVNLNFHEEVNQVFVEKIANYVFIHNVKALTVVVEMLKVHDTNYYPPPCMFKSMSLKHFTLRCQNYRQQPWDITKTDLDFTALTSLNLTYIRLCNDLFSKCVNLKNLTLKYFSVVGPEEVFTSLPLVFLVSTLRMAIVLKS